MGSCLRCALPSSSAFLGGVPPSGGAVGRTLWSSGRILRFCVCAGCRYLLARGCSRHLYHKCLPPVRTGHLCSIYIPSYTARPGFCLLSFPCSVTCVLCPVFRVLLVCRVVFTPDHCSRRIASTCCVLCHCVPALCPVLCVQSSGLCASAQRGRDRFL